MLQTGDVLIRAAKEGDAPEIANVHLNSWREAYRGLLPQEFLDQLPLTFKRRMSNWERTIRENKNILTVAEAPGGLVGFSIFNEPRDKRFQDHQELSAIYLFEKWKGKGIGHALLRLGMNELINKGATKAYCWVLEANSTRRFYERTGARPTGLTKDDEIGGMKCQELAYVWNEIESFKLTEPSTIRFEAAKIAHVVPELTALLHRAYGPLAERGMKYLASHQPPEKTLERLSEGESYIQFVGNKVTGTISLVPTKEKSDCEYYMRPGVYSFHQFAIDPKLQGHGLGSKLMDLIEKRAAELGANELALDTSEHADHLIDMYKKRGYEFVQHVRWSAVNYRSVVMSKTLV